LTDVSEELAPIFRVEETIMMQAAALFATCFTWSLLWLILRTEDGGDKFVLTLKGTDYTALCPRRQNSSAFRTSDITSELQLRYYSYVTFN
jgi:hypothetical protein